MRVGLISDIHGNAVALRAVLDELESEGVDKLVCLGDVATLGPRPREVLALLRERDCDCVVGNHDAFLLDPELIRTYGPMAPVVEAVDWCRQRLDEADLRYLRTFAPDTTVELGQGLSLRGFHGTPRSHMEDLLCTTPTEDVDGMLAGETASVIALGHTHLQMLRQHRGTLVVNPGSIGSPFSAYVGGGTPRIMPHAEYAIVEASEVGIEVRLRRRPLDGEALSAEVIATDHPLAAFLVTQYRAN